jgi:excisionase family DNA binding protein
MSTIKGKAGYGPQNVPVHATGTHPADHLNEVLTLSEAAAYLRVAEAEVLRLVHLQELPGRQIGNEWRFLKAGLQEWLRTPDRRSGKEAFLALAGAWKDDPDIEQIVRESHRRRGRPIMENKG